MKVQVKKFSTHQTAKVFGFMMFVTSLLFAIPFSMIGFFASSHGEFGVGGASVFSLMTLIFMPVFQGIVGYIVVRLSLWIYNKLAAKTGGIEFEYEAVESQAQ